MGVDAPPYYKDDSYVLLAYVIHYVFGVLPFYLFSWISLLLLIFRYVYNYSCDWSNPIAQDSSDWSYYKIIILRINESINDEGTCLLNGYILIPICSCLIWIELTISNMQRIKLICRCPNLLSPLFWCFFLLNILILLP